MILLLIFHEGPEEISYFSRKLFCNRDISTNFDQKYEAHIIFVHQSIFFKKFIVNPLVPDFH